MTLADNVILCASGRLIGTGVTVSSVHPGVVPVIRYVLFV